MQLVIVEGNLLVIGENGKIVEVIENIAGKTRLGVDSSIVGNDGQHRADVELLSGKRRLLTSTAVTIEELLGKDPKPDSYFTITNAGAVGDTIRLQIAATTGDTSAPDRDAPAVDETYTLVAEDVGDELKLRDNLITFFNGTAAFGNALLKAQKAKDLAIVHITSTVRSLSSEFYERPNAGDFQTTVTGTTTTVDGFDNLISRGKAVSLARDPDAPHQLGILGIEGSVTTTPGAVSDLVLENVLNGGSANLLVDGSVTPVTFSFNADSTLDTFLTELRFVMTGGTFKFKQFLSQNDPLDLGVEVKITSNGIVTTLPLIKATEGFKHFFSIGDGRFQLESQPAGDDILSSFIPGGNIPLLAGSNDKIEIKIQDNLISAASLFEFLVIGFKKAT